MARGRPSRTAGCGIPDSLGTAVTVQRMVFGNMGETSATRVAFTRNPATGDQGLFGEFLLNARGEDVVAGIRTRPLSEMETGVPGGLPAVPQRRRAARARVRGHAGHEFTIERDRLYMLQTRAGKRTGAALRMARDMAEEGAHLPGGGSSARRACLARPAPPSAYRSYSRPRYPRARSPCAEGSHGEIVLTAGEAKERAADGEAVLLVRRETNPDDVEGMIAATGVLTALGGMTSPRGGRRPRDGKTRRDRLQRPQDRPHKWGGPPG